MQSGYPFPPHIKACRVMYFVDGENLAMRYGALLPPSGPLPHVAYSANTFVWSPLLNMERHTTCDVVRRHYYTSVQGDEPARDAIHRQLRDAGIEAPRVFPRTKARGSKRVDISLAVDMLSHAHRGNYDLAVLVAGDEDYVPLVEAVAAEGRRVALWFFNAGLSPALERLADHVYDIGEGVLFRENAERYF